MASVDGLLDPFDRTGGNGSSSASDDWLDSESIYENEWGSTAATTFDPSGEDGQGKQISGEKRERFERLYRLHNGKGEQSRKETIRASYITNDTDTFLSVLEMPSRQRDKVHEIVQQMDISSNNFGGRPYEKIILCVCSLVSDEALSEQPNPSVRDRLFLTDRFRELMEANDMSSREHRQIRASIREKSSYFD
jgi:hypothetical protein